MLKSPVSAEERANAIALLASEKQRLGEIEKRLGRDTIPKNKAELEVNRFKREMGRHLKHAVYSEEQSAEISRNENIQLRELESAFERAKSVLAPTLKEYEQCQQSISEIEAFLRATPVSAGDLKAFQDKAAAAKATVDSLSALIAAQQEIIVTASAKLKPSPDFTAERQTLLAEIALGNAAAADLEDLDRKIEQARKDEKAAASLADPVIESASHTIQGLTRKLEAAQAELTGIKRNRTPVVISYLESEANREADEYVGLADRLMESYKRLKALDRMLVSEGGNSIMHTDMVEMNIPVVKCAACDGRLLGNHHTAMHNGHHFRGAGLHEIDSAVDSEWARIKSIGEHLA